MLSVSSLYFVTDIFLFFLLETSNKKRRKNFEQDNENDKSMRMKQAKSSSCSLEQMFISLLTSLYAYVYKIRKRTVQHKLSLKWMMCHNKMKKRRKKSLSIIIIIIGHSHLLKKYRDDRMFCSWLRISNYSITL